MNRNEFFGLVSGDLTAAELKRLQVAYWFAKDVHRGQERDSGERYFEHVRRATVNLIERGVRNVECLITGLVHDVAEDTNAPDGVIHDLFGPIVHRDVMLLSKSVPSFDTVTGKIVARAKKDIAEYYAAIEREGINAPLAKFADRMDNLSTCFNFAPERKARYIHETETYILPMAQRIDPWFVGKLTDLLNKVKAAQAA